MASIIDDQVLIKAIDEIKACRDRAASEAIIFQTEIGRALASGRAYAYHRAWLALVKAAGIELAPYDEFKEQRRQ